MTENIVILDGARRTPRADILIKNREPGLFSRFTTTQLGGFAIEATLANTPIDRDLIGHVVMGMAAHSHRDSIYAARGMSWRGGLKQDVPALTVARICGSGAEAVNAGLDADGDDVASRSVPGVAAGSSSFGARDSSFWAQCAPPAPSVEAEEAGRSDAVATAAAASATSTRLAAVASATSVSAAPSELGHCPRISIVATGAGQPHGDI